MIITNAQYKTDSLDVVNSVQATIDGQVISVPLEPANRHYAEILKQVAAGDLTIAEAD
jgi:hypothetical protein